MALFKCKMCGGDLTILDEQTVCECEYCGTRQTVPKADDEKKLKLFARAGRLLRACEFDKAAGVYESIVADFDQEAEAYWGLILCKYGIEYVDDPATGKKIPTCHRSSFDGVLDDANFELVMENADTIARPVYRTEAKEIERLRKGILEVSAQEEPYDVFICYKETDEQGDRTVDSLIAQDVYTALTEKGYRVFFSRISLEDKLGQEYEPYIFAALHSARVMLAFGTSYENYDAVWVKNEWSRFLSLMAKGEKKTLIPCYKDLDAYDMPKEFQRFQAQDMGKVGAMQDLLRGVEKIIGKKTVPAQPAQQIVQQIVQGGGPNVAALLKRGQQSLEDMKWKEASGFFDQVLSMDAENSQAFLGLAMAKERTTDRDAFAKAYTEADSPLRSNEDKNIIRARQYDKELDAWFAELDKEGEEADLEKFKAEELKRQKELEAKFYDPNKQAELKKENEKFLDQYEIRDGVLEMKPDAEKDFSVAVIPEGVRVISKGAFADCSTLQFVKFPATVEEIGDEAFSGCRKLQSAEIPESVTRIGKKAFNGCRGLTNVTIPKRVTAIEEFTFVGCDSLVRVIIPDGVTHIGKKAFSFCGSLSSVTIPKSVSCMEEHAFDFCKALKSVTIADGVTHIQKFAFSYCSSLMNVTIPASVVELGPRAFGSCSKLTAIHIADGNPCYREIDGVAFSKDGSQLICYPAGRAGAYRIPEAVSVIGEGAFAGAKLLSALMIPKTVNAIARYAFTGVDLPTIEVDAENPFFMNVDGVLFSKDGTRLLRFPPQKQQTAYSVPSGVTVIDDGAFASRTALISVTLPIGVLSIGNSSFSGCTSLNKITIPDSVTSIGNYTFSSCKSLIDITIPDSVITIGDNAFSHCESLKEIMLPKRLTSIGAWAFDSCKSLKEIHIPAGVTSIGELAFDECGSLKSIALPNGVTSIGHSTFNGCKSMTQITLSEGLTSIGSWAFYSCESLKEINVPEGVISIDEHAFCNCKSLRKVVLPESLTAIGKDAFSQCGSLKEVNIPAGVDTISESAFSSCESLKKVTFSEGLTVIGREAFSSCDSLQEIVLPEGLTSIGDGAFSGYESKKSVTIPDSVTSIGEDAFGSEVYRRGLQICAVPGSYAEEYAKKNRITVVPKEPSEAWKAAIARAEAERRAADEKAKAEKIAARIAALNGEKTGLQTELNNLRGLFTGKRRREIESRLAEIDAELKKLG